MLPTSRDQTLAPGSSQVSANLLNSIQDMIVGHKYPTQTVWFPPTSRTAFEFSVTFSTGSITANANAAWFRYAPAPLREGDRVTKLRANVKGTGAAGNVVAVMSRWKDGVQTDVGTLTIVDPPNAWANYEADIGPFIVQPGECYWLGCDFALLNQALSAFGVDFDRL